MAEAASDQHWDPDIYIDVNVAHPARVYDYWLGGKDNFAADRVAGDLVLAATPGLRYRVRANRAFLGRTVRYLAAEAGVRQFLDLGTGIPSADNTHEVRGPHFCLGAHLARLETVTAVRALPPSDWRCGPRC